MDKNSIIKMVQGSCPGINNLSQRTWEDISEALECIIFRDEDLKGSIIKVFRTISGQIRHDVSEGLRLALEKQQTTQELNN
jgi:hypothetical protein